MRRQTQREEAQELVPRFATREAMRRQPEQRERREGGLRVAVHAKEGTQGDKQRKEGTEAKIIKGQSSEAGGCPQPPEKVIFDLQYDNTIFDGV